MAVSIAMGASFVGVGMVVPVRVLYAQAHGASLAVIGAMASAFLISNFIFQYPSGWIADRWGHKQLILAGMGAQAVLTLAYLPIGDPWLFVVLRFFEGMAFAATMPPARALVAEAVQPEKRGEAYGLFGAFMNAGFLLGPGIGGLLASVGYTGVFIGSMACRIAGAILVLLLVKSVSHVAVMQRREGAIRVPRRALFTRPLVGAYILGFGDYLWLGFDLTLFALWLRYHLGASITLIGIALTAWSIPSIIMGPIGGRLADRRRRSTFIIVFGLAQVPFYIVYGLLNSYWPFLALIGFHAVMYMLVQPAVDAHLAAASPEAARARIQGLYSSIGMVSSFIAANALSYLYGINYRLPLFVLGGGFGLCIIVGGVLVRQSEAGQSFNVQRSTFNVQEPATMGSHE